MRVFFLLGITIFFIKYSAAQNSLFKWEKQEIKKSIWPKDLRKSHDLDSQIFGIYEKNALLFKQSFGNANFPASEPIDQNTIFYTGSFGQMITAICILKLWNEKRLNLNDSVRKYFPTLPAIYDSTTIQHLLLHTSGNANIYHLLAKKMDVEETIEENIDILGLLKDAAKDTKSTPGSKYFPSISNYWLLAKVIKKVTGITLKTFAFNNVFQPLNMSNTRFSEQKDIFSKAVNAENQSYYLIEKPQYEGVGMGGLYTSMGDLQIFLDAFFEEDFFDPSIKKKLLSKVILNNGASTRIKMAGIKEFTINGKKVFLFPQYGSKGTLDLVYLPEIKSSFIYLNNYHHDYLEQMASILTTLYGDNWIEDLTEDFKGIEFVEEVTKFNGRYIDPNTNSSWRITLNFRDLRTPKERRKQEDEYYIPTLSNDKIKVVALSPNKFLSPSENVIWEFFPIGNDYKMKKYYYGLPQGTFYEYRKFKLSYEQILQFTGSYQSPSGKANEHIKITRSGEESISGNISTNQTSPLFRLTYNKFITEAEVIIQFKRNDQKKVVGMYKISKDLESLYYQKID